MNEDKDIIIKITLLESELTEAGKQFGYKEGDILLIKKTQRYYKGRYMGTEGWIIFNSRFPSVCMSNTNATLPHLIRNYAERKL